MPLFQKSVTNKYLKNLDTDKIDKAFENFQKFYGNKLILANIMQLKEENYQEGFLREIFVETLGYIINPDENYNLRTKFKKQKVKLTFTQQDEWEDYFDNYKTEINNIQNLIKQTDKEIDKMVYELYELTAEEIEIVENSEN